MSFFNALTWAKWGQKQKEKEDKKEEPDTKDAEPEKQSPEVPIPPASLPGHPSEGVVSFPSFKETIFSSTPKSIWIRDCSQVVSRIEEKEKSLRYFEKQYIALQAERGKLLANGGYGYNDALENLEKSLRDIRRQGEEIADHLQFLYQEYRDLQEQEAVLFPPLKAPKLSGPHEDFFLKKPTA